MRFRDQRSCQMWYENELKQADERLEGYRSIIQRIRSDVRPAWEHRLDEIRGRLNRGAARLEAVRRGSVDNWRTAAFHADEAFLALTEALDRIDEAMKVRSLAA